MIPLRSRLAIPVIVVAAGACALDCARREASSPPTVMRIGIGEPPKGMPNTGGRVLVAALKADTWLASKPDGRVGERIVASAAWESNGTVLRLRLRPDVYFHDGTHLTPETAAESLRATDTSTDNFSLQSIAAIQPDGDDTILLRLKEHNAFLLPDLAAVSVLKAGAEDVGTGPYQLIKRNGRDATLKAFPRYYHGQPALAGIDVVNYPTQRNAWTALMRGDIDMLYEVSRDSEEFVRSQKSVRTYPFQRPYYIPLVFNMRHPILGNLEVRRAINEALDRNALVMDGLRGQGAPADGPVSPLHWAYSPPTHPFVFDPAAARSRLDTAGFALKPSSERGVPVRFSFKCVVFGNDSRFERLAVIVQKQLADVGIDMQLQPLPLDVLVPRIAAGDFDAFLFEMSGPRLSRVYDFWRSRQGAMNNTGYRAADAVLDRLRAAQTDEDTRAGVADLLRVMHDDPPAAFLAWQKTARAVSTRFDVAAEPDRDILTTLWMWRPASAAQQASR